MGLLRGYVAAGFSPDGFWRLTPRLYVAHMRGAGERAEFEYKAHTRHAWQTANLMRAKEIPSIEKLLRKKPKLSPEEISARLKAGLPRITLAEWRARKKG